MMDDPFALLGAVLHELKAVQTALVEARAEIAHLRWVNDNTIVHGPVTDVDPEKHLCRIQTGVDENGQPVKSSWRPYGQIAGTRKVHSPPSVGQQLTFYSPAGDINQAVALPFTWSDNNPSPSQDGSTDVDQRGKTRSVQKDGAYTREVDGVAQVLGKQSHTLTVYKDEQSPATVDDKHPWQGNKGDVLHTFTATKDGGFVHKVNVGGEEHSITVHPTDGIKHSFNNGDHVVSVSSSGITHKSKTRVTIDAPQSQFTGDVQTTGSIFSSKTIQSASGLIAPAIAGVPGAPPPADTWS